MSRDKLFEGPKYVYLLLFATLPLIMWPCYGLCPVCGMFVGFGNQNKIVIINTKIVLA